MAASRVTSTAQYTGKSIDPFPTSVSNGALVYHWDTRQTYEYDGASWTLRESVATDAEELAVLLQALLLVQCQTLEALQEIALKFN